MILTVKLVQREAGLGKGARMFALFDATHTPGWTHHNARMHITLSFVQSLYLSLSIYLSLSLYLDEIYIY